MKKILVLTLFLICLFALSGCQRVSNKISFREGIGNLYIDTVTKVEIRSGDGELRETNDTKMIDDLLNDLSDQTFTRAENQVKPSGFTYYVNFYLNNSPGWGCYTLDSGFNSYEGYKGKVIDGRYLADDPEEVKSILKDFFNQLEAQPDQQ